MAIVSFIDVISSYFKINSAKKLLIYYHDNVEFYLIILHEEYNATNFENPKKIKSPLLLARLFALPLTPILSASYMFNPYVA